MNAKIIIGSDVEEITQNLSDTIRSLVPNTVIKLDKNLLKAVLPSFPDSLKETKELYGLKLVSQTNQTMTHSGWLYSYYLDACRKEKVNYKTVVALYNDGLFREFTQFGILKLESLFLGFGLSGEKMLTVILQAESQFNPNDFDQDGYAKEFLK